MDQDGERLPATFGVYEGLTACASINKWMQFADAALYQDKELGRNRVAVYDPEHKTDS